MSPSPSNPHQAIPNFSRQRRANQLQILDSQFSIPNDSPSQTIPHPRPISAFASRVQTNFVPPRQIIRKSRKTFEYFARGACLLMQSGAFRKGLKAFDLAGAGG
jgi:hypothetical protein